MSRPSQHIPIENTWFSMALRSIGDAVIATDGSGRILFMNSAAEQLTGWPEPEAVQRGLVEIFRVVHEVTRVAVENPVERVLRERCTVGLGSQTVLIGRHGKEIPIDDSAAPIVDGEGNLTGVILVFRDVTEERQAALLRERLAAVVESSDDVIVTKTLDGTITSWNKGAERVLGYAAEEVIGKHVSMLMPPEAVEDLERILGCIRRGERVDHYETKRRRKDGTVIDVSLTVSPIRSHAGEIVGASKIGRDISVQKRIETERMEADRRKDEFLAMLAHELRNPIASINSAAQLFARLETEEDLEWAKEVVLRQVKHLARLIDDLLDVSRITRGKIDLRKEHLDIVPVVSSAVETVRPFVEERKHELTVSLAPGVLRLEADPLRLEQVLVNLLTNAAKYTESGGRIWLTASRETDHIVIKVTDSGLGITPELLPRIFDLFAQGDRSRARSEGGLGIGLTLVKSLVELHGGTVTAASAGSGQGSEFTVRIPASKESGTPKRKAAPIVANLAQPASRVLVVDDNVDTARALGKLLKLLGHDVKVVHDGEAAIDAARTHRPEIVLLDIGLPGMDGYDVAATLRREECCRGATLVAVSGYGQEADVRRSQHAGFDHHLVKPVDYDSLMLLLAKPR
jgi:PAS domain S-box-containing protein